VTVFDAESNVLRNVAGHRLPAHFLKSMSEIEVGPRNGSCAAAIYLQRQVVVAEIARDALWEFMRAPALAAGLRACWSTPIRASDGRMLGTVANVFPPAAQPAEAGFRADGALTALAGIAIERKQSEEALRHSEARYRGLFENVIEGVYRTDATGASSPSILHWSTCSASSGRRNCSHCRRRATCTSIRPSATASLTYCSETEWCAVQNSSFAAATAR